MDDVRAGDAGTLERDPDTEAETIEHEHGAERRARSDAAHRQSERGERADDGRGRSAEKPSDIPARGWKDILWRVYAGISDDRILANSAAVTFYALLALFPAIAALVSIYGLFTDPASIQQHLDSVSGVLPGGAVEVIRNQLNSLAAQPRGTLGISFLIGLAISLWSANGGIKGIVRCSQYRLRGKGGA